MNIPSDCSVEIEEVCFDGLVRPKFYLGVSVESAKANLTVTQYLNLGFPFFLRLRLNLAVRRCIRMLDSFNLFIGN